MALSPTEKLSIVRILNTTPSLLDAQITVLGASLDSDRETAIREELTRWETAGIAFVQTEPKESNFGAKIDADLEKDDIRQNLLRLLEFPLSTYSAGAGTMCI